MQNTIISKASRHTIVLLLTVLFPEYTFFKITSRGIVTIKKNWYSLSRIKKNLFELTRGELSSRLTSLFADDTKIMVFNGKSTIDLVEFLCSLYGNINEFNSFKTKKSFFSLKISPISSNNKNLILVKSSIYKKRLESFKPIIAIIN